MPRPGVLIYLANETRPRDESKANYDVIMGWLSGSEWEPERDQLAEDLANFPGAVARDLQALENGGVPRLLVASNESCQSGTVFYRHDVHERFAPHSVRVPIAADYILRDNPLSRPEGLIACLQAACDLFHPETFTFAVVLKSHGHGDLVAVPRLCIRHEETTRSELLDSLDHKDEALGPEFGTTNKELLEILERLGSDRGMRVSVLVLDACRTGEGLSDLRCPKNIDAIAGGIGDLDYETLDFSMLEPGALTESLRKELETAGCYSFGERFSLRRHWLFLPLIAFCLVILGHRFRWTKPF